MPAHSRKSSRRHRNRSLHRKSYKKPTLKHNKWRIVSHRPSAKGSPRTVRNIRRAISHMIPHNMNVENGSHHSPSMVNAPARRERLSRASKSAQQAVREAEQAAARAAAEQRNVRREQRREHEQQMNELSKMMSGL
jgi:translation initiation factor 2B subunit (eIF-2B alpha/beta/delta family)